MTRLIHRMTARLASFLTESLRREDGTATMEFVLVVPVIMMIFMASFESGLLMIRTIMLEQSVDMTMRELRLGHYPGATNHLLKQEICARTVIFPNCTNNLKIEMNRISTTTWVMPATPPHCINRQQPIDPVLVLTFQQNDVMLVKVCIVLDAMFPATGIASNMVLDSSGGYAIITRSAFSIEPS